QHHRRTLGHRLVRRGGSAGDRRRPSRVAAVDAGALAGRGRQRRAARDGGAAADRAVAGRRPRPRRLPAADAMAGRRRSLARLPARRADDLAPWVGVGALVTALLAWNAAFAHADRLTGAAALAAASLAAGWVGLSRRRDDWVLIAGLGVNLAASLFGWHRFAA